MDFFYDYKLHKTNNGYEVILFMRPNSTLEEFAEEFGLTKRSEEDINRIAVGYVKKKFPSLKIKTIKVMIGGALITTIMFGGSMTHALANEDETTTQSETTTETSPDGTTDATSETTTGETTTDGTTETNGDATTETTTEETSPTGETTNESTPNETEGSITPSEEPAADETGMLPGDFFYFVKTLSEKISIALTFDDTEKAQKLAEFASVRIAEANALLAQGDTEGAAATLQKALENQELALDYSEKVANETGAAEGDGTTDAVNEVSQALEEQFTANTMALLLAMEKVDNPKAKEALAKNIEKSFERMSKKLEKMGEIKAEIQEKIAKGDLGDIEDLEEDLKEIQGEIEEDQEEFEEEMEEVEEKNTEAIAHGKDREKEERNNAEEKQREAVKKQQEASSKAEESKREEAKKQAEKQREEAKKQAEKQREEAKKQAEKSKEEAKKSEDKKRAENEKRSEKERQDQKENDDEE